MKEKDSKCLLSQPLVLPSCSFYLDLTLSIHPAFLDTFMCKATAASQHLWQEENIYLQHLSYLLPDIIQELNRYPSGILLLLEKQNLSEKLLP